MKMSGSVEEMVALVRQLAAEVGDDAHYESIVLAAHLFALCMHLRDCERSSDMEVAEQPDYTSKAQVIDALAALSPCAAAELYAQLLAALVVLEAEYRDADRDALALPTQVPLRPLPSWPGFLGTVRLWHRESARWPKLRHRRAEWVPERHAYPLWPADHLEWLGMLWDKHETPRIQEIPPGTSRGWSLVDRSGQMLERDLRIALCPLPSNSGPRFQVLPPGNRLTVDQARPLLGRSELQTHLRKLLDDADRHQLHLLVMPELSVDEDTRAFIQGLLGGTKVPSLLGIIAGSFHVWREQNHLPVNEAVVLGRREQALWTHHKRGYFRTTPRQIRQALNANPDLYAAPLPDLPSQAVVEDIRAGHCLRVLDSSLGRLAVVICADAIDGDGGYFDAIKRARPDLLFIVAMSPKCDRFRQTAEFLEQFNVSTFFINAASACPEGSDLAFAHLALAEPPGAPPTRLRWLAGVDGLQRKVLKGRESNKWRPVENASGAFLLPENRGLVVNLGEHWRFSPLEE